MMVFNHIVPNSEAHEIRGPFHLTQLFQAGAHLRIADDGFFGGGLICVGGVDPAADTRVSLAGSGPGGRRILPVGLVTELARPRINDILMWIDPAGFRWLNETWLKVDRGVEFYNHQSVPIDPGFLTSRVLMVAIGLGAVVALPSSFRQGAAGASFPANGRQRGSRSPSAGDHRDPVAQAGNDGDPSGPPGGGLARGPGRARRAERRAPGSTCSPRSSCCRRSEGRCSRLAFSTRLSS